MPKGGPQEIGQASRPELDEQHRTELNEAAKQLCASLAPRPEPIIARPYQPDGDAVVFGVSIELRMPAKAADVGFVGKIHGDLGFVANRMQ